MDSELLELKARVASLDDVRERLSPFTPHFVAALRQVDTYFDVPRGRLKLREIDGAEEAKLIYYEREDVTGPKQSKVWLMRIPNPTVFKVFFGRILPTKVVIDKERAIYMYRGTQIHLDVVKNLGTFIEFERTITDVLEDRKMLERLMEGLGIDEHDLVRGSYSDLAS